MRLGYEVIGGVRRDLSEGPDSRPLLTAKRPRERNDLRLGK